MPSPLPRLTALLLWLVTCLTALPAAAQVDSIEARWQAWDELSATYDALMEELDDFDPASTRGDRQRRQAIEVAEEIVALLQWLIAHDISLGPDELAVAWDVLLTTRQVLGSLYVETRQCAVGGERSRQVLDDPEIATRPLVAERARAWLARAENCLQPTEDDIPADVPHGADATPPPAPPAPARPGFRPAHTALVAGGALALSAAVWDLALMGARGDFLDRRQACYNRGCTPEETADLRDLQRRIQTGQVATGVLYGVGAAGAAAGLALLLANRRDAADRPVRVAALLQPDLAGVQVRWRPRIRRVLP
jgi:hypothetical protein